MQISMQSQLQVNHLYLMLLCASFETGFMELSEHCSESPATAAQPMA